MKSIDVIYKFGNLYDRETHKRILLQDGSELSIVYHPENMLDKDPNLEPEKLLDSEQKELEVKTFASKEGGSCKYWKLFDKNTILYFEITAGIKGKDNKKERIYCIFQIRLLEDLYIYNKKKEPKFARFFDCHCIVERCLSDFDFFEPIYTTSLNDSYTKTYELYFAMFGKSTCNAFDRFCEDPNYMNVPIRKKTELIQS